MKEKKSRDFKRLQSVAEALVERLKMLSGREGDKALQFATDVSRSMLGMSLDLEDRPNLDDDQAYDLSIRIEGFLVVLDIIAAVFLVERLKMMINKNHWMAIYSVNDFCFSALKEQRGRKNISKFNKKQRLELILRVRNVLSAVGVSVGDPYIEDVLPKIIERYEK